MDSDTTPISWLLKYYCDYQILIENLKEKDHKYLFFPLTKSSLRSAKNI